MKKELDIEKLYDAVYESFRFGRSAWVDEIIQEAIDELYYDDVDIDDVNIEADPYYSQLSRWLNEDCALEFCDEAIDEGLTADRATIYDILSWGQYLAIQHIYYRVNDYLQENAFDDDDSEDDSEEDFLTTLEEEVFNQTDEETALA